MTIQQLAMAVTLRRDHFRGAPRAPVTLLEYGDYECPHCGAAQMSIAIVRQRMGDQLRFAYRHFPLTAIHPRAERAAEAAEAAGAQGQFWPMHDLLFENQQTLEDDNLIVYADQIGLNVGRFASDLASARHAARVRDDFLSGLDSGVKGTPTFFVNGLHYTGAYEADSLVAAVQRALPPLISPPTGRGVRM
ncbi:MAG: oxidoreductase [Acidobacteria bacterium]|nr:oxidoreductase [Acidobacteriota bacterium]